MLPLLLHTFTSVYVLSVLARVSAVTTVVGVAGRGVTLPCHSEAVMQRGVEVCWGRGEPSLFTCHNTVIDSAGDRITYRKLLRYSVSPPSSLSISSSQPSDSGFYHCRVQLPGLFNDQTALVHLIIINPRAAVSTNGEDAGNLNAPHTMTSSTTEETGSDVTGESSTEPVVALVQSAVQQPVNTLQMFVGNTVRTSFIIFIPALLLAAAHSVWKHRAETDRRPDQSAEEEEEEEEEV